MAERKFCIYCGAPLTGGERFCERCGKPLQGTAPAPANTPPAPINTPPAPQTDSTLNKIGSALGSFFGAATAAIRNAPPPTASPGSYGGVRRPGGAGKFQCIHCHGTGNCHFCHGAGYHGRMSCIHCNGSGRCNFCGGSGWH